MSSLSLLYSNSVSLIFLSCASDSGADPRWRPIARKLSSWACGCSDDVVAVARAVFVRGVLVFIAPDKRVPLLLCVSTYCGCPMKVRASTPDCRE